MPVKLAEKLYDMRGQHIFVKIDDESAVRFGFVADKHVILPWRIGGITRKSLEIRS